MTNEIKEILVKDFNEILVKEFCTDWKEKRLYIELLVNSTPFSNLLDYITNLQEKYDKSLELLSDFNVPCECVDCKIPDEYCEKNCNEDYKKCWNKHIEIILRGDE